MPLTDNDLMPFGKHKNKPMKDVPHGWFIYMHDRNLLSGQVKQYAEENVPILKFVADKKKGQGQ